MPARNELNMRARAVGFDGATIPNDSKLEQKVIWLEKNAAAKTGTAAVSTLTSDNTEVADGDTVTIGPITYRFKTLIAQAYDILRDGTTADTTLTALKNAINGAGTPGTDYYTSSGFSTSRHPFVTAGAVSAHAFTVTAKDTNIGSDLVTTTTAAHLSFTGATLNAGTPGVPGVIVATGSPTSNGSVGVDGGANTSI